MQRLNYTLLLLLWYLLLPAQNPHPAYHHYTTDEGLPDLTVYQVKEDRKGYLWFATDNGVCRFNGYEFERFPATEAAGDINYLSVFDLQEDTLGRMWFNSLTGNLYYVKRDSIFPYWFNDTIQSYDFRMGANFYVVGGGEQIFIELDNTGILEIQTDGSHKLYTHDFPLAMVAIEMEKELILHRRIKNEAIIPYAQQKINLPIVLYKNGIRTVWKKYPLLKNVRSARTTFLKLEQDAYLLQRNHQLFKIQKDTIAWRIDHPEQILETLPSKNKGFYFCMSDGLGLKKYASLENIQQNKYHQLLANESVTWACEDINGGLWISTHGNGVFYTPNPDILIYDSETGLSDERVQSISLVKSEDAYIGLQNGEVLYIDNKISPPVSLVASNRYLYFVFYDKLRNGLWIGNRDGFFKLDQKQKKLKLYCDAPNTHCYTRISRIFHLSQDQKTLIGASYEGVASFDLEKELFLLNSVNNDFKERIYGILEDKERRIWLANKMGLRYWENTVAHYPDDLPSLLKNYTTCIGQLSDSTLVVGFRSKGLVLWKGKDLVHLSTREGLSFDEVNKVHIDKADNIWAVTAQGLNRVTRQEDGSFTIRQFTKADGLPSNTILDVKTSENFLWIATAKGLVKMPNKEVRKSKQKVLLSAVEVNGVTYRSEENAKFKYLENSFSFQYYTLNYRQMGRIKYRYRLLPSNEKWTTTNNLRADYPALQASEYRFEVASQQENGSWGEVTTYEFEIRAPWWKQTWFYCLIVIVLLATLFFIYLNRVKRVQKEFKFKEQVTDLEKKALQAQMNPHFIFNCLNSIQRLVMEDEKQQAMQYLGSFSKLVRATLNASVEGEVSLEEEINALQNYLKLEQLRFKNSFDYQIEVAPELNTYDTVFPPMLLQPFVENAIIHGMQAKTQNGYIHIRFLSQNEQVIAIVEDNGKGIHASSKLHSAHKSVGLTLTKRRLELLHGVKSADWVRIEEKRGEKGLVLGTVVRVVLG